MTSRESCVIRIQVCIGKKGTVPDLPAEGGRIGTVPKLWEERLTLKYEIF